MRTLKALDSSRVPGKFSFSEIGFKHLFGEAPVDAEKKEKAVWIDIDKAFSRPVTLSDESADYVPTQILAELFRDAGYDAIVYKSQYGENGYDVVLFDPEDADAIVALRTKSPQLKCWSRRPATPGLQRIMPPAM